MAALFVSHAFCSRNSSIKEFRGRDRNCPVIVPTVLSCRSHDDRMEKPRPETKREEEKGNKQDVFSRFFAGVQKFGCGLKENMSPKQKGDWKDVMLMSLSFAVYVYMSQKIVCAYCAWMSMPKQSW